MLGLRYLSKGMLAAITLSVIISFMISLIPNLQVFQLNKEFPVFGQKKQSILNENNIVNFVASFSTEMQIKRVSWKADTLSLDFYVNPDDVDTSVIYRDMYTVIRNGFVQSSNVNEVLLRVFLNDSSSSKAKMLVAVSAQKRDIVTNPTMTLEPSMMYRDFLEKYFGLTFGNLIKQD